MKLHEAKIMANEIISILKPFCTRIEVAGSIRRSVAEVGDIDIVLIQHPFRLEQFLRTSARKHNIIIKNSLNPKLKYGPKYKQILYKGNKIELWIADKNNWGLILAIRTGSANFSAKLLSNWKKVTKGGESHLGMLHTASGKIIPVYEEDQMFQLCNMEWIDPSDRSL